MGDVTIPFTGGCFCKAIRYESRAAPKFTANCHCKDCQRFSAGAFVSVFAVPVEAFTVTGECTWYEVTADSGNQFQRGFCPRCGTPLFGRSSGMPSIVIVRAGTLDDPSWYRPALDIYTESALPWTTMDPALTKFPRGPRSSR
jgi:hypothetical protein